MCHPLQRKKPACAGRKGAGSVRLGNLEILFYCSSPYRTCSEQPVTGRKPIAAVNDGDESKSSPSFSALFYRQGARLTTVYAELSRKFLHDPHNIVCPKIYPCNRVPNTPGNPFGAPFVPYPFRSKGSPVQGLVHEKKPCPRPASQAHNKVRVKRNVVFLMGVCAPVIFCRALPHNNVLRGGGVVFVPYVHPSQLLRLSSFRAFPYLARLPT